MPPIFPRMPIFVIHYEYSPNDLITYILLSISIILMKSIFLRNNYDTETILLYLLYDFLSNFTHSRLFKINQ